MKKIQFNLFFLLLTIELFAHESSGNTVIRSGISLGSVIAVVISWDRNKNVLYATIHGILSWIYVIYYSKDILINRKSN